MYKHNKNGVVKRNSKKCVAIVVQMPKKEEEGIAENVEQMDKRLDVRDRRPNFEDIKTKTFVQNLKHFVEIHL